MGQEVKREFLRFLFAGSLATATQYVAFGLLTLQAALDVPHASGVGYLLGALVGYLINHGFTFSSARSHSSAMLRFAVMVAAAWLLTLALMALLANVLGWHKWLAQLATTAVCLVFNYLVARSWVFRSGSA